MTGQSPEHENLLGDDRADPLFWRPTRVGVESAWYGHIPLAHWIVQVTAPRVLVELGTHTGVSYSAFCEAVINSRSNTSCFAIDTWAGDEHAGSYGEEIFTDLEAFHRARYAGFSQLLRSTFDDALSYFADGTIDLLHIDGRHFYDDVRHDFESWRPKLSPRAVVLFHDTNVRERGFGVWRLWSELRLEYPSFEFLHASGLGVLAFGAAVPQAVAALCRLRADDGVERLRSRFALIGERWIAEARLSLLSRDVERRWAKAADDIGRAETRARRAKAEVAGLRDELAAAAARRDAHESELAVLRDAVTALRQEREIFVSSTIWRATSPLRALGRSIPVSVRNPMRLWSRGAPKLSRSHVDRAGVPQPEIEQPSVSASRVVYVSGEAHTPGHHYRVLDYVQACRDAAMECLWVRVEDLEPRIEELATATAVIIWRARFSPIIARLVERIRAHGGKVLFDIDDLMFRPELAKPEFIDGIRSQRFQSQDVAAHFLDIRRALALADACTCTTAELARELRALQKTTFVLPNGFSEADLQASRLALRRRSRSESDAVRIGYASGTRTHQRDFAQVAPALARVLRERPSCKLVLFRAGDSKEPVVDADEFECLESVRGQIEWRDLVPLEDLPTELARFDINLTPLEPGSPFCEAKSELKFFEAALVEVCTIASPTGPMQRVIRDGENGLLADSENEWYRALKQLVDDAPRRRRLGHAAYLESLWPFSPARRSELVRSVLGQLNGGPEAARGFALELQHSAGHARAGTGPQAIRLPETVSIFAEDQLGEAEATVIIPLFNYADFVVEALESVRAQTVTQIDLVVVDDGSTDRSLAVAVDWARRNAGRFNRIVVLRNRVNSGLAITRNAGFDAAETPYILPLDADNRLLPRCVEACLDTIKRSKGAFVYPAIRCFGESDEVRGELPFVPMRLTGGNYIDAMALVAKWAWAAVGGYQRIEPPGWEDYDFWCRCAEHGFWGVPAGEILAEYRVHDASMLHTATDLPAKKAEVIAELERRHPWLAIPHPTGGPESSAFTDYYGAPIKLRE